MEEESFFTIVLKKYLAIQKEVPELIESLQDFPTRVKVAKQGKDNELLVFFKKGRLYVQGINYDDPGDGSPYTSSFEEVFERITCKSEEPKLELSKTFWDSYKDVKNFREAFSEYGGARSIEAKAINNLKTLSKKPWLEIKPQVGFIKALLDDIMNYGSLSDFTLRRISILETTNENRRKETEQVIEALRIELGESYMLKEKTKLNIVRKEIIIAIENQKP